MSVTREPRTPARHEPAGHGLDVPALVLVAIPLGFVLLRGRQGHLVISGDLFTEKISAARTRRRTAAWARPSSAPSSSPRASLMAVPARRPRRHLPPRVRRQGPTRPPHPVHDRRHDRRAVDRHGPVHLRRFTWALGAIGLIGLRRLAGAGLPHAAGRDPLDRGDAPAGARRPAPGQLRARQPQVAHDPHGRAAGRARRHRERAACSPSPALPARRRRCCSPSAPPDASTGTSSPARTRRCRSRSGTTRRALRPGPERAWGAALTLVVLVFLFTVLARVVSSRFSLKHE